MKKILFFLSVSLMLSTTNTHAMYSRNQIKPKHEAIKKRVSQLERLNINRLATEAELATEQQRLKTL